MTSEDRLIEHDMYAYHLPQFDDSQFAVIYSPLLVASTMSRKSK